MHLQLENSRKAGGVRLTGDLLQFKTVLSTAVLNVTIWEKSKGEVGVGDTYIHSDVNYPLWYCLIEKHRLSLAPGIPAEQPRHNPSGSQCHDKETSEEEPSQCSLRTAEVAVDTAGRLGP